MLPSSGAAPNGACWFALTSYYLLRGLLLVFLHRLTRKRVDVLYYRHLVVLQILFDLILNIRFYCRSIFSDGIYVLSPTPEMSVPILVF